MGMETPYFIAPRRKARLPAMGIVSTLPATLAAEVLPAADPLAALAELPGAFALRSSLPDRGAVARRARWSFFGADPFAVFRGGDTDVAIAAYRTLAASAAPPG